MTTEIDSDYRDHDTWRGLFNAQRKIQELAYGKDPYEIVDPVERIQFIKDMHTAITMELGEMLDETGWKPWATSNHVNEEAMQGELADVLLFFINLCMAADATPEVIAEKTFEKMKRNLDRQLAGYDGVTGKCVRCKRALDDTAVTCVDEGGSTAWCGEPMFDGTPYGVFMKAGRKDPNV
jgi:NTP pyrophosphatase (non-canonical NTP hydrolase)